ncbi:MAG TPA: helix-turn-helix domain-containing protein [Azospirillum sp.]|nr:helix-turn-helix domain-containing protein [Azospirillum sp.]
MNDAPVTAWPLVRYDESYYDIRHVADHFGVTVRTLERWRDRGKLVIISLSPKQRVVSREALLRFELTRRGTDIGDLIARMRSTDAPGIMLTLLEEVALAKASADLPEAASTPQPECRGKS